MTVGVETPFSEHNGDGITTAFAPGFSYASAADIVATVGGAASPWSLTGGNVVFVTAPPVGVDNVLIQRQTARAQQTTFGYNGSFSSSALAIGLDRLMRVAQEIGQTAAQALAVPLGSTPPAVQISSPTQTDLLGFNGDTNTLVNIPNVAIEAAASANAAAASASLTAGYYNTVVADTATCVTSTAAAANSALLALNYMNAASGIAAGTFIDSAANVVIGPGSVAPTDGADGGSVVIGNLAGVGTSQTYTRKLIALGIQSGIGYRGYATPCIGTYTGARACSDYGAWYGTHAGQDYNSSYGNPVPGYGTRAVGSITFTGAPANGDVVVINGVTFTAATAPSGSYQYQIGTGASDSCLNLFQAVLNVADVGVVQGLYQLATGGSVINIQSGSRGAWGNNFTLAATSAAIALSGATLTGGAEAYNSGLGSSTPGNIGVGFTAGLGSNQPPAARKATLKILFSGNPASGSIMLMGVNLSASVRFMTTPSLPLDIQLGATLQGTLANAVAFLNSTSNTYLNVAKYWTRNGVLFVEMNATNSNYWQFQSQSSTITADYASARGGELAFGGANTLIGYGAFVNSVGSGNVILGQLSAFTVAANNSIFIGGGLINGDGNIGIGNNLTYYRGDNNIAIGNGLPSGATSSGWQTVASMSSTGVITFAAPHGFPQGDPIQGSYQDSTGGASVFQISDGSGGWITIGKGFTASLFYVLNEMQVQFVQTPQGPDGSRLYTYQISGTPGNLQVTGATTVLFNSASIGYGASTASQTFHIGSRYYTLGLSVDAIGLYLTAGQLRITPLISGIWASGSITFFSANGNLAVGDTITLAGTAFTAQPEACLFQATTTSGSNQLVMLSASVAMPVVGQTITGTGIPGSTTITAVGTGPGGFGTLTMSNNATATSAATGVAVTGIGVWSAPSVNAIRYFAIGLSLPDTLYNFLECVRNSDDQSAAAQAVNQGRFWLTGLFNAWKLNFQATNTLGNSYTLATSHTGAAVVAPAGGTVGNLPVVANTPTYPPQDKGLVMISASPKQNGQPGLAQYSSATDSWRML